MVKNVFVLFSFFSGLWAFDFFAKNTEEVLIHAPRIITWEREAFTKPAREPREPYWKIDLKRPKNSTVSYFSIPQEFNHCFLGGPKTSRYPGAICPQLFLLKITGTEMCLPEHWKRQDYTYYYWFNPKTVQRVFFGEGAYIEACFWKKHKVGEELGPHSIEYLLRTMRAEEIKYYRKKK